MYGVDHPCLEIRYWIMGSEGLQSAKFKPVARQEPWRKTDLRPERVVWLQQWGGKHYLSSSSALQGPQHSLSMPEK